MKINKDDIKKRITYRASYRGTKELDILISTFVSNIIDDLSYDELDQLEKFVNLDDRDLIKLNKLKIPYNINVGDKIFIPKKKNYSVIDQLVAEIVYSLKSEIKKNQNFNNKIIKDSPKFIWPAKGILIKKFGSGLSFFIIEYLSI